MSDFSIQQMNQADAPGIKIVVISGEMTIQNAGEIRNALLEAFSRRRRGLSGDGKSYRGRSGGPAAFVRGPQDCDDG